MDHRQGPLRVPLRARRPTGSPTRWSATPETGELRAASWPEAFAVAARGLQAARARVGVLTGGRLTAEDAYAYSKFARVALGTNDIDFRARPHSAEEADVPGRRRSRGTGQRRDLRRPRDAPTVVVLRRPRARGRGRRDLPAAAQGRPRTGTRVFSVAPYTSRGLRQARRHAWSDRARRRGRGARRALGRATAELAPRRRRRDPRRRAARHRARRADRRRRLAPRHRRPAAWVPRRAGDRGALEAGCLPNLLPGGRPVADAAARVDAATAWGVDHLPDRRRPRRRRRSSPRPPPASSAAWSSAASTPTTWPTPPPPAPRSRPPASWSASSCARPTVTERADVVLPGRPGHRARPAPSSTGRAAPRPFDEVLTEPALAARPPGPGRHRRGARRPLGLPDRRRGARAEMDELGPWDGERRAGADRPPPRQQRELAETRARAVATWKQLIDDGSMQDGDDAPARRPPAGRSPGRRSADGDAGSGCRRRRGHRQRPTAARSTLPGRGRRPAPTASSGCRPTRGGDVLGRPLASPAAAVDRDGSAA